MATYNSIDKMHTLNSIVASMGDWITSDRLRVETLNSPVSYLASCVAAEMEGTSGAHYPFDTDEVQRFVRKECGYPNSDQLTDAAE